MKGKIIYKNSGGFGFTLFVVFLILKLTHTINWSWWIITMPLWIGLGVLIAFLTISMVVFIVGIIVYLFITLLGKVFRWN